MEISQYINKNNKNNYPLILIGDVFEKIKLLPDECIDLIITSPPYWKLRDYEVTNQIGLEETPEEYINKICDVANELKRVLKKEGSFFLNLGDKYVKKNLQLIPSKIALKMQNDGWILRNFIVWHKPDHAAASVKDRFGNMWETVFFFVKNQNRSNLNYYFNLDAVRIPHKSKEHGPFVKLPLTCTEEEYEKVKLQLEKIKNSYNGKFKNAVSNFKFFNIKPVSFGHYDKVRIFKPNRQEQEEIHKYLIKCKESAKLKTKDLEEYFRHKKVSRWFSLGINGALPSPDEWIKLKALLKFDNTYDDKMTKTHYVLHNAFRYNPKGRNPGDVWSIPHQTLREEHFAAFPEELVRRIIKAACPSEGIVLDPFAGSGTTGKVALELKRKSILIELNPNYVEIIKRRLEIKHKNKKEKALRDFNIIKTLDEF